MFSLASRKYKFMDKSGMVGHTGNLNTSEAKKRECGVKGQPELHSKSLSQKPKASTKKTTTRFTEHLGLSGGWLNPEGETRASLHKALEGGSPGFCSCGLASQPNASEMSRHVIGLAHTGCTCLGCQALESPVKLWKGWALETAMHGCGVTFLLFMGDCGLDLMSTSLEVRSETNKQNIGFI